MARYVADSLYIASIYPGELEPIRRNYGPSLASTGRGASRSTLFQLEPVPRGGKPFVLELVDSFEDVLDLNQQGSGEARKPKIPKPVPVETIVADVLAQWTGGLYNVPQGAKPGIIQIAGKVPTSAELAEMQSTQTLYFEYLFTEGDRLHQEKAWKDITNVMRLAAEWLGHQREWSHRSIARDTEPCPLCTTIIPNSASICPSCRQQISFVVDGRVVRFTAAQILGKMSGPETRLKQ